MVVNVDAAVGEHGVAQPGRRLPVERGLDGAHVAAAGRVLPLDRDDVICWPIRKDLMEECRLAFTGIGIMVAQRQVHGDTRIDQGQMLLECLELGEGFLLLFVARDLAEAQRRFED